ncbi:hypothetical protein [Methylomonas fluvii]|uniref:Uncharacterized protein n=1 Tax=Methylomonas fluvii TaxID=1854564 RepID=A0ABR9DLF7_9GAMM|nr:hypothetical protein [Methylomonas fluvii]MBD9362737.1 hypothetical protein [Methylomonas fluvii]CAD6875881.1 hypothetical protein [Methylomonas fluvii]
MSGTKLTPEKITSPFQLMAAWFAMLVLLVSILLTAANNITKPEWAAGYLVIFTSVLVVLVLGCVTLMLTISRPHLQDGKEYAQWLKDKNTYSAGILSSEQVSAKPRSRQKAKKSQVQKTASKFFSISVTNAPGADALISALKKSGFSAEVYTDNLSSEGSIDSLERHEAIWVGCELPAKEAIESIKVAVTQWPHLKYMHLSNDNGSPPDEVHYEMYFGGASSTAEKYDLSPWSYEELMGLDENMSPEDFHRAIRSKYP